MRFRVFELKMILMPHIFVKVEILLNCDFQESNNGYVKCSYGEIGKLPVCEKKSETKIKVSMKLKGKKANKNKFICQMTVSYETQSS